MAWHFRERNPFHYSLSRAIDRYADSPPPEPDALDTFRFATPGRLPEILIKAAVTAPTEHQHMYSVS